MDAHAEHAHRGDELVFRLPKERVVVNLVHRRQHPTLRSALVIHLNHLPSREVRQSELREEPLLVELVARPQRVLEHGALIGLVQVEDVHLLAPELGEREAELAQHALVGQDGVLAEVADGGLGLDYHLRVIR